jgi:hypothetical protein
MGFSLILMGTFRLEKDIKYGYVFYCDELWMC